MAEAARPRPAGLDRPGAAPAVGRPPVRAPRGFWRRLWRHRPATLGLALVGAFVALALLAPILAPADPHRLGPASFRAPAADALLGTDNLGRDVSSRILYGARTSLLVGVLAALASSLVGMAVGALAGYYGGLLDDALMRFTELFQVIPRFLLAIVTVALFGASLGNLVIVIAVLSWPTTARLVRGQFLALQAQEFVQAGRALGVPDGRLIVRELLPNAASPIIVDGSFQVASAILLEAGLSFLGLGDPNLVSWGQMLQQAQAFLRRAWWLATFPGGAISLVVLGLNLLGDGLNDLLNPRQRMGNEG
jgi:peptide/nickel transport system permease protein